MDLQVGVWLTDCYNFYSWYVAGTADVIENFFKKRPNQRPDLNGAFPFYGVDEDGNYDYPPDEESLISGTANHRKQVSGQYSEVLRCNVVTHLDTFRSCVKLDFWSALQVQYPKTLTNQCLMAPVQSGLYRATHVEAHHFPKTGESPFGVKFPGEPAASNSWPQKWGYKGGGTRDARREENKYIEVRIDKANEILGMDNFRLHPFCVSAYYPGESDEVINSRKTSMVPAKKSALGSRREDCFFFETIRVPYNPRQQLLHVEIFEVQVPLQMELEDEWVGRATVQLADPKVDQPTEYELTRGPFEYGGTVTVSVKLPPPEVEARPLPDLREFPQPVSPRHSAHE
eukprot:s2827_g1.t1